VVLGLAASGVHSNGFSLVRRVAAAAGVDFDAPAPFAPEMSLAGALMVPTKLYVLSVLALHRAGLLKAAAHITGGGLPGNLPRALPEGTVARLDAAAWDVPPVFRWLAQAGGIAAEEMLRVFNCGIGMTLIVAPAHEAEARAILEGAGETVFTIGVVEAGGGPARAEITTPAGWPA
jgi:phosphoribosylformylglycinamidine cyclo-ligase